MRSSLRFAGAFGCAVLFAATSGFGQSLIMSVHSATAPEYRRPRAADGAYKREHYAISNGGPFEGTLQDNAMAKVPFADLAGVLAEYLAAQNYYLARDSKTAELLLVVHWGATLIFDTSTNRLAIGDAAFALRNFLDLKRAPLDGSVRYHEDAVTRAGHATTPEAEAFENAMIHLLMLNRDRDRINERNAILLGYVDDANRSNDIRRWAGGGDRYQELIADLEESRYYITVSAYDFRLATQKNQRKLLWITRMSIRAPGNSFEANFRAMIASGARHFGQSTGRVLRGDKALVEIGESQVLGIAAPPDKTAAQEEQRERAAER